MRTSSIYIALSLSFFSISDLLAMNQVDVESCKAAFQNMIDNNGKNIWKENLKDHVNSTNPKDVGDTYFYTDESTQEGVSTFLSKNSCKNGTYNFLGKNGNKEQWKCTNICKKKIGYKYNVNNNFTDTKAVYFTIQKSTSNNNGSKWMIFNLYPNG